MKIRHFIYTSIFLLAWTACSSKGEDHSQHTNQNAAPQAIPAEKKILYYVDPMHPWYKSDKPGTAPDCGMDLVPVYNDTPNTENPSSDKGSVRLSSERQQLIGIKIEEVQTRNLIRDIQTNARVASDPELFLAQQDFLISSRHSGGVSPEINSLQSGLVKSARNRLEILGMSPTQIGSLQKSGRAQNTLLLPSKGASTWLYGSIYESDLPFVKQDQQVEIFIPGHSEKIESKIDSIAPNIDPNTRTAQVRVSVANPFSNSQPLLRPEMFVKIVIHADLGSALSIPDSAVIDTGLRKIAFVEKEAGIFEPREIQTGKRGTGYVEVISGLSAQEKVVSQGNFLLDSESSLKGLMNSTEGHSH